ncbi:MAG: M48 family metalloprotease, partial [Proteobacteria bacterium]|nr:M48 family metalloprotease [Pseudomonadota bacterium]
LIFDQLHDRYRSGEKKLADEVEKAARNYSRYAGMKNSLRYQKVERTLVELSGDPIELIIYDARSAYKAAFTERRIGRINQKMAQARASYAECLRSQPANQRCHYGMGLVHASVKASEHYDRRRARQHFTRAGNLPDAKVELARMMRLEDDLQGARSALAGALAVDPKHQRALFELGVVSKLEGRDRDAIDALTRAYQANRFSADAARAVDELTKIDPHHKLVKQHSRTGIAPGDIFATDRFKAAIALLETHFGGVDRASPETAALAAMLSRLLDAADVDSSTAINVAVLKTKIPNAFALPNGNIYFTRGLLDFVAKQWPDRPLDADHDIIAHVMAHEVAHVIRRHTVQSTLYREAVKSASRRLDAATLTHVTRLHEIEADRVGIVLAFLAGYHPRGGIEIMEARGALQEIPKNLDHPTFDERVHYLEEYWSNDVKYAFVSFELGVAALADGDRMLATGSGKAAARYQQALDHFRRFRDVLKPTKALLNNLGVVRAKLGIFALARSEAGQSSSAPTASPLHRWQTDLSVEQKSAIEYVSVVQRGADTRSRPGGVGGMPKNLRHAVSLFKDALKRDPGYLRARLNLAAVYIAMGNMEKASRELDRLESRRGARVALLRGIVYAETKQYDKAAAEFRAAMQKSALKHAGTYNLARLYQLAGDRANARDLYRRYLKTDSRSPWADAARRSMKRL